MPSKLGWSRSGDDAADFGNSIGDSQTSPENRDFPGVNDSRMEVNFDGHYKEQDRGLFGHLSPVTLGIICACAVVAVLLCVVGLLWITTRRRRQKLLHDLTFDDGLNDRKSTKSAPASRQASPRMSKRLSCPDALSVSTGARGMMVRSMTADRIPDFTLPPERIQPLGPTDRRGSLNLTGQQKLRLGSIAPDLYIHQSFSEEDEPHFTDTPHGRLWYSVLYDATVEVLQVTINKVKELPGRNNGHQLRDPFVKIFLLPDERTCRTSKVKRKTLNPVYNETFTFQVTSEDVKKRVLRFSVYDVDKRRVRHSLGHVMIKLKTVDLTKGDVIWSDLESMVQAGTSLGDLQLSLLYLPSNEKVKVVIHRTRNLNYFEEYPDMGVYVRIQLFYGHRCYRIKRTAARPGGANMSFDESLSFTVNTKQMDSCSVVISLMLTSSRAYTTTELEHGRVVVGPFMYARGDELAHWQEMLSQPKVATTRWHSLTNQAPSP